NVNPGNAWDWITLVNRLLASGVLVGAAFCPDVDMGSSRRLPGTIVAASASALLAIAAAMLVWRSHLPSLLGDASAEGSGVYGAPHGHPLSYLQLADALLAALAAVGLARHAAREDDWMERSIAAGVAVLAVARFNYFLVP